MELIWQNVSVWYEVKLRLAVLLLHLDYVVAESVFAGDLITLWEVIYPLELIQTFVKVAFAGAACPENIPLVRVSKVEAIGL